MSHEKGSDPAREYVGTDVRGAATSDATRLPGHPQNPNRDTSPNVNESHSTSRRCAECGQRPAVAGANTCEVCRAEYSAAQRRRREAEWRLPPLEHSHHEPALVTMVAAEPVLLRAVTE